jgi:hypothetical protein
MYYLKDSDDDVLHSELLRFWTFPTVQYSRDNVSETDSVSIFKWREKTPAHLGPIEITVTEVEPFKGPNCVGVFPPPLKTETDPVS